MSKPKLIRITTVPQSLRGLLRGQLRFMSENGYDVIGVSSPGEALKDVEKNEGVRTVAITMTRTISPYKDLKALFQLVQLLRKEKPEIVHTHTPKAGLLGMMAAKIVGVPHRLHTVAGMPLTVATGFKRVLLNQIEKLTYWSATMVYPNSLGLSNFILKSNFAKEDKIKVIGKGSSNGIDTKVFDPKTVSEETKESLRNELGISKNDFVFLFVGRVVRDKGINELIAAFEKFSIQHEGVKLLLVGGIHKDDPISQDSFKIIDENKSIIIAGIQRNVVPFYAISNVFVFPSYREGFPNVVMEASAMELPSIVTDINGCNEIVTDGVNGIIVSVQNSIKLFEAMSKLYEDSELYKRFKDNTRSNVQFYFERMFVWQQILKEYKKIAI